MAKDKAVLDFGSEKLRVLTGLRGVNDIIQVTSLTETEYDGFLEGDWLKPELLSSSISYAINSAEYTLNTKIRDLYVGVPSEFTLLVVKNVSLSFGKRHKITESDIDKLFKQGEEENETNSLIARQPIYYTLDDETRLIDPVGMTSKGLEGLICYIYAENRFTAFLDSIFQNIGIETAEYISPSLAQALYLIEPSQRDKISILIDIGYITSTVMVVRGDGLLSLNSFSLGGGHISADFANYFKVSFSEAEALKRKVMISIQPSCDDVYMVNDKEFSAQLVNKIASARISVMAKAVNKCLEKCAYNIPPSVSAYLTGGGVSYIRGAKELIANLINRQIEIIAPPSHPHNKPHLSSSISALNMSLNAVDESVKKRNPFRFLFKK